MNKEEYYEGWYLKHQNNGRTLCFIPGRSEDHAFIQIITDEKAFNFKYPLSDYRKKEDEIIIGNNIFSVNGVSFLLDNDEISIRGTLNYRNLTRLKYDIMGPFSVFPMETKHTVISMNHDLYGSVKLNGETLSFNGGKGYIEGDRGSSFPKNYSWVQCNDFTENLSIMLAIANIPFGAISFTGCIGIVQIDKDQYRFATYKGVKILEYTENRINIKQGSHRLVIETSPHKGHGLPAPDKGKMDRIIHENPSGKARFKFYRKKRLIFDCQSDGASYEYVPND